MVCGGCAPPLPRPLGSPTAPPSATPPCAVFNNNAMPGFPLGIAGCGTNESPHWLGTIPNMPVTPAVGADCLTTVLTPPPAMGLAAPITITARLFAQRTFTTSNTAPAAGAAAAPALEQAGLIGAAWAWAWPRQRAWRCAAPT